MHRQLGRAGLPVSALFSLRSSARPQPLSRRGWRTSSSQYRRSGTPQQCRPSTICSLGGIPSAMWSRCANGPRHLNVHLSMYACVCMRGHAWARVGMCMCMCGHVCVHVRGTACTRAKGVCLGMHMQGAGHAIRTHCTEDLHTELHSGAALSAPYLPPADESPVGCRAGFDGAHRSLGRARRNHPHTGESHAAKFRPAKPGWLGGRQGRHRWRQWERERGHLATDGGGSRKNRTMG